MRLAFMIGCIAASVAAGYYGQPYIRDNAEAITAIVTVLTVFAGFLVAIMAILGDPAMIPAKSWRSAENRYDKVERLVIQHQWLFYLYLTAIGVLFAAVLARKMPHPVFYLHLLVWVERAYLGLAVLGFLLTLTLPKALGRLQLDRIAAEIEVRRSPNQSGDGANRPTTNPPAAPPPSPTPPLSPPER